MQNLAMHIGKRIKVLMKDKRVTNKQVANYCGVTEGAVSNWFSSGRISKENLAKVATLLGVTTDELITGEHATANITLPGFSVTATASNQAPALMGSAGDAMNRVATGRDAFIVLGELLKGTDPVTKAQIAPLIEQLSKTPDMAAELGERLDATIAMGSSQATPFTPINPFPKK